jgi:hypothetical protein
MLTAHGMGFGSVKKLYFPAGKRIVLLCSSPHAASTALFSDGVASPFFGKRTSSAGPKATKSGSKNRVVARRMSSFFQVLVSITKLNFCSARVNSLNPREASSSPHNAKQRGSGKPNRFQLRPRLDDTETQEYTWAHCRTYRKPETRR